ncbi:uncharacterized protein LOC109543069 isoform X2 [Dendroctonus ponderosae]|uniref:Glycolipid transfer protein domain-containing protein n=1 Tax=Dendroctonus ponderosae TaxID=77166 RepID=A0AAR5Q4M1_DENPD|nr:uncharacterized protein LOC109543069 isoform X2 [Dendroctonus ponderosae]
MSELNRAAASRDAAKTAFSVLQVQFPVATDRLRTLDFLEAAHGLVTIVERFGKVFAPVINDMNGNIKSPPLSEPVLRVHHHGQRERARHAGPGPDDAAGLFRNVGALPRLAGHAAVQRKSPSTLDRMAAAQSLPVLQVMSRFAPNRSDLFYTLALDHSHRDEQVLRDLRQYHQRMAACVLQLTQFYADHRLEDGL